MTNQYYFFFNSLFTTANAEHGGTLWKARNKFFLLRTRGKRFTNHPKDTLSTVLQSTWKLYFDHVLYFLVLLMCKHSYRDEIKREVCFPRTRYICSKITMSPMISASANSQCIDRRSTAFDHIYATLG